MKKTKVKIIKSFIIIILGLLLFKPCVLSPNNISYAKTSISIDSSKFIYSPSFSTFYNDKLYFIDNYNGDNYFKVFSTAENENYYALVSKKLENQVVYAYSLNNLFFILFNGSLNYINLNNNDFELSEPLFTFETNSYSSVFVSENNGEFIITLTPSNFGSKSPIIILFDTVNASKKIVTLNDDNLSADTTKTMLATIKLASNNYCYLYFGESKLKYLKLSLSAVTENYTLTITNAANEISSSNLDTNSNTDIAGINMISITNETTTKDLFLVTYKRNLTNEIDYYRNLYSFDFSEELNFTFDNYNLNDFSKNTITLLPFVSTYKDFIIYPTKNPNPQIHYLKVTNTQLIDNFIKNPTPTNDEYTKLNYKIKSIKSDTYLLQNPWEINSNIRLAAGTDILVVGTPLISSAKVENLYYCLYTSKNSDGTSYDNYGYIPAEYLKDKPSLTFTETNLAKTVKVFPGTCIYSLPSKASDIKLETDGNFAVEIEDLMCGYKTANIEWVRVSINNFQGYIDRSRIDFTPDRVDFIVTNATISRDGTYVYSSASANSAFIISTPLSKGKSVYIDGVRDTKTGFTKIRFNDDYGNEFEGYVRTENIKSNTWSQLQIIGSILIAINFGILILIIVFKKKKLSHIEQQKISSNEDEILR